MGKWEWNRYVALNTDRQIKRDLEIGGLKFNPMEKGIWLSFMYKQTFSNEKSDREGFKRDLTKVKVWGMGYVLGIGLGCAFNLG